MIGPVAVESLDVPLPPSVRIDKVAILDVGGTGDILGEPTLVAEVQGYPGLDVLVLPFSARMSRVVEAPVVVVCGMLVDQVVLPPVECGALVGVERRMRLNQVFRSAGQILVPARRRRVARSTVPTVSTAARTVSTVRRSAFHVFGNVT